MKKQIFILGFLGLNIAAFAQWSPTPPGGTVPLYQGGGHLVYSSGVGVLNWGNGGANDDLYLRSLSSISNINSYTDRIRIKYNGWTTFWGGSGTNATNPSDQIHIFPSSGANGITITNSSTTGRAAITLENSSALRKFSFGTTGSADAAGSGNLVIRDATANADRMTFHSNGKIGIGSTNPSGYLHVKNIVNNNNIPTLLIENTSQGIYQDIKAQVNKVMKAENKGFVIENTMSNVGEVFKIYGEGRTLIGLAGSTEVPTAMLQVKSPIARESFRIYNTTETANYLSLWHAGSGGSAIDPIGSGKLYLGYDQQTDIYIGGNTAPGNNASRLGIGTSNPLAALHVTSRAVIGGATASNISAGSNVSLGVFQNSPIGIGQCIELRSGVQNPPAVNTLLIVDDDNQSAIQVDKFMNPGYQTNFQVKANGKTIIGNLTQVAPHNDALLTVNGKIVSKSLYVRPGGWGWPDFVFDENYIVPNLYDIEKYYKQNKHLPDVPSALEVEEKGIEVAEMNKLLLQKLEEMTILMVKMQKEIDALKQK
ncbi:MAG: hypothetical protein Q8L81_03015 [Bacteroidota bacterium]|nr:hypothetical protein [Bacteroidota bacterium]